MDLSEHTTSGNLTVRKKNNITTFKKRYIIELKRIHLYHSYVTNYRRLSPHSSLFIHYVGCFPIMIHYCLPWFTSIYIHLPCIFPWFIHDSSMIHPWFTINIHCSHDVLNAFSCSFRTVQAEAMGSPSHFGSLSQHNWMSNILNDVYWYCPH